MSIERVPEAATRRKRGGYTFDSAGGAAAGRIGGSNRWKDKDPASMRNRKVLLAVTEAELAMMDAKAATAHISRTELIIRAVSEYTCE